VVERFVALTAGKMDERDYVLPSPLPSRKDSIDDSYRLKIVDPRISDNADPHRVIRYQIEEKETRV
jgi:hypothetical protein